MSTYLDKIVSSHKEGARLGIYSVCSAEPLVLAAACRQAVEDETALLVEATSNQVDQFGGYTGMTPQQFRDYVHRTAEQEGVPESSLILGGDHLGTNSWRHERSQVAMEKARDLVQAYVRAGFTKIHLDCTFVCSDDEAPLSDDVVSERAAVLLAACEEAAKAVGTIGQVRYVIGTEVPVPGGHQEALDGLQPTSVEAARATIAAHRENFLRRGLEDVWPRICGLVVQPGVEFDSANIVDYRPERTEGLQHLLDEHDNLVYEAHSTDYQRPDALRALVRDHWAILKVGPGLTFALREALLALTHIEDALVPEGRRSNLREVMESTMVGSPRHWQPYYAGTADEQRIERTFSYSDRVRYYWPEGALTAARERLFDNLAAAAIPETLLSQYLPRQYDRVREGCLAATPRDLVIDRVRDAIRPYADACRGTR